MTLKHYTVGYYDVSDKGDNVDDCVTRLEDNEEM